MNLRLDRICPCERQESIRLSASEPAGLAGSLDCPAADCSRCVELEVDRLQPDGGLLGCLSCGHPELYTRKDFPPAVGISIVVVAALLPPQPIDQCRSDRVDVCRWPSAKGYRK